MWCRYLFHTSLCTGTCVPLAPDPQIPLLNIRGNVSIRYRWRDLWGVQILVSQLRALHTPNHYLYTHPVDIESMIKR